MPQNTNTNPYFNLSDWMGGGQKPQEPQPQTTSPLYQQATNNNNNNNSPVGYTTNFTPNYYPAGYGTTPAYGAPPGYHHPGSSPTYGAAPSGYPMHSVSPQYLTHGHAHQHQHMQPHHYPMYQQQHGHMHPQMLSPGTSPPQHASPTQQQNIPLSSAQKESVIFSPAVAKSVKRVQGALSTRSSTREFTRKTGGGIEPTEKGSETNSTSNSNSNVGKKEDEQGDKKLDSVASVISMESIVSKNEESELEIDMEDIETEIAPIISSVVSETENNNSSNCAPPAETNESNILHQSHGSVMTEKSLGGAKAAENSTAKPAKISDKLRNLLGRRISREHTSPNGKKVTERRVWEAPKLTPSKLPVPSSGNLRAYDSCSSPVSSSNMPVLIPMDRQNSQASSTVLMSPSVSPAASESPKMVITNMVNSSGHRVESVTSQQSNSTTKTTSDSKQNWAVVDEPNLLISANETPNVSPRKLEGLGEQRRLSTAEFETPKSSFSESEVDTGKEELLPSCATTVKDPESNSGVPASLENESGKIIVDEQINEDHMVAATQNNNDMATETESEKEVTPKDVEMESPERRESNAFSTQQSTQMLSQSQETLNYNTQNPPAMMAQPQLMPGFMYPQPPMHMHHHQHQHSQHFFGGTFPHIYPAAAAPKRDSTSSEGSIPCFGHDDKIITPARPGRQENTDVSNNDHGVVSDETFSNGGGSMGAPNNSQVGLERQESNQSNDSFNSQSSSVEMNDSDEFQDAQESETSKIIPAWMRNYSVEDCGLGGSSGSDMDAFGLERKDSDSGGFMDGELRSLEFFFSASQNFLFSKHNNERGLKTRNASEDEEDQNYFEYVSDICDASFLTAAPPGFVNGNLLSHVHMEAVNFLISLHSRNLNGILADPASLDSSPLAVACFFAWLRNQKVRGPLCVIASENKVPHWLSLLKKHLTTFSVIEFTGKKDENNNNILKSGNFDVCVTSHDTIDSNVAAFQKFSWRYLVFDETGDNELVSSIKNIKATGRIALVDCGLKESSEGTLWHLLYTIYPSIFTSVSELQGYLNDTSYPCLEKLQEMLKPFFFRRELNDLSSQLPQKTESVVYCKMTGLQEKAYRNALADRCICLRRTSAEIGNAKLWKLFVQLRKACAHPFLFEEFANDNTAKDKDIDHAMEHDESEIISRQRIDQLVQASGKMHYLDLLLKQALDNTKQVVVYSSMARMLDIISEFLTLKKYDFVRIDASTKIDERLSLVDDFNAQKHPICLVQSTALGVTTSFHSAAVGIIFDSDYNYEFDQELVKKIHRTGQKGSMVEIYSLVAEKSFEEKLLEKQFLKVVVDEQLGKENRVGKVGRRLMQYDELILSVMYNARHFFRNIASEMEDEKMLTDFGDLSEIIDASRRKIEINKQKLEKFIETTQIEEAHPEYVYLWKGTISDEEMKADSECYLKGVLEMRKNIDKNVEKLHDDECNVEPLPKMDEWQLFNIPRLQQIHERELKCSRCGMKMAETLLEEKQKLLQEGFPQMTQLDFKNFCLGVMSFGWDVPQKIFEIMSKPAHLTLDDLERYSVVLKKFLGDHRRLLPSYRSVCEKLLSRKVTQQKYSWSEVEKAIVDFVKKFKEPMHDIVLRYVHKSGFKDFEDRWLLVAVSECGFGMWPAIQRRMRQFSEQLGVDSPPLSDGYQFRTRTIPALEYRVTHLYECIIRSQGQGDEPVKRAYTRGGKKKVDSASTEGGARGSRALRKGQVGKRKAADQGGKLQKGKRRANRASY